MDRKKEKIKCFIVGKNKTASNLVINIKMTIDGMKEYEPLLRKVTTMSLYSTYDEIIEICKEHIEFIEGTK